MKKIGFGIIGCGAIAQSHAYAVKNVEGGNLVACSDINEVALYEFCEKNEIIGYNDVKDMLENEHIDVVCICTPSGLHERFAIMAAKAKKHIVIEKPMALTVESCDKIIKTVKENDVLVEVICQNRFLESFRYVKKIIEEGKLGKIINADIYMKYSRTKEYYAGSNWRGTWKMDGGGALMNQGIHGVDIMLYLVGDAKSVFGHTKTLIHDIEVEDTASAIIEYKNGGIGVIQGTTSVTPGHQRKVEINGEKGSISLVEGNIVEWEVEGIERPNFAVKESNSHNDPMHFSFEGHKMQIQDIINAINENKDTYVNAYEGKKPVELITSIYKSSNERKLVIL